MLTTRGAVLVVGAAGAAVAGLAYGVEEFVFLGISVGVLLVLGAGAVWVGARRSRSRLRVVVTVPVAEVTAHQAATVAVTIARGGGPRPSVRVENPDDHWTVSHPGLAESSVGGSVVALGPPPPGVPPPAPPRGAFPPSVNGRRRGDGSVGRAPARAGSVPATVAVWPGRVPSRPSGPAARPR